MVIVPTREAGRRLLAALTAQADAAGLGVLPPEVLTPDACLRCLSTAGHAATRSASQLVLAALLQELDADDFPELFPETPPVRDWPWALEIAGVLLRVRDTLADAPECADFSALAKHPANTVERERWVELARIEAAYRERLHAHGLADANDLRRAAALSAPPPAQWRKIWLVGTPDPTPLLPHALERMSGVEVGILVAAPEATRAGFDDWGRVIPEFWMHQPAQWENFFAQTRLTATPDTLGDTLAGLVQGGKGAGNWTTIGVLDHDLAPVSTRAVERAGAEARNPEGKPMRHHKLGVLLHLWHELLSGEEARAVPGLLRLPFFMVALVPGASGDVLIKEWDALREAHLPDTLRNMLEFAEKRAASGRTAPASLKQALEEVDEWRQRFEQGDWADTLRALLEKVFAGKVFHSGNPSDRETREVLEAILDETDTLAALTSTHRLMPAEWLALILRRLETGRVTAVSGDRAVPLLGWLELLWEDAPHLILAGLNDGYVPAIITADPFLPGSFREKLGLPSNNFRLATAFYTLQKLIAQRTRGSGKLDVLVLQTDAQGNPLRPSPLLFSAAGAELPERVRRLFADPALPSPEPAWLAGWKLAPPVPGDWRESTARLPVTRFRDYLECPFRFFLRQVLRMNPGDPWKTEPDAREFGSAIHYALEAFAKDAQIRESTDASAIARFATAKLEAYLK
ncbi:MAG: PD-(D/E)XK nuclease family protein, partial [Puniceicoccales bacterium]|nr:PD-(D/E)XK nuclease family protein [Puniceicoccales bacterium]